MAAVRDQGDGRPLIEGERSRPASFADYPGVYRAADAAAVAVRRQHFAAEAVQLLLNPVAAGLVLLSAIALLRLSYAVLTAVSTTMLVIVLWFVRAARWQKLWYECRSAAEDVKRLTWRYMMALEPFPPGMLTPDAPFVKALDAVLHAHPEIREMLGQRADALTPPVTAEMRRVRKGSFEERADFYLEARVEPELAWYAAKARRHAALDRRWFAGLVTVQVAAVLSAIWLAVRIGANPGPATAAESAVPLLAALGSAVMGWQRSKRFADLSGAYAGTAHALAGLVSARPPVSDEEAQREWIEAVEAALASEHEAWRLMM